MKCERCGNQLDDTDLFCPKCGKAVFEEYMDDDDIWDEYDREPKVGSKEKLEISKEIQPEKASKVEETKESPKEENKQEEAAKMPQIPKEESKPKRKTEAKKADKKTKKTTSKKTEEVSGGIDLCLYPDGMSFDWGALGNDDGQTDGEGAGDKDNGR